MFQAIRAPGAGSARARSDEGDDEGLDLVALHFSEARALRDTERWFDWTSAERRADELAEYLDAPRGGAVWTLVLSVLTGEDSAEVGEYLGLSSAVIRKRLERGRSYLAALDRATLAEVFGLVDPAAPSLKRPTLLNPAGEHERERVAAGRPHSSTSKRYGLSAYRRPTFDQACAKRVHTPFRGVPG